MGSERKGNEEERELLPKNDSSDSPSVRHSNESLTSVSTTSLILENINGTSIPHMTIGKPAQELEYRDDDDLETPQYIPPAGRPLSKGTRRVVWIVSVLAVVGWGLALASFLVKGAYKRPSNPKYNHELPSAGSGRPVTLEQVISGRWYPYYQEISWIAGADGEDGLLLEKDQPGKDHLVVEDVRNRKGDSSAFASKTLMKQGSFDVNGKSIYAYKVWPSPDLKSVLVLSGYEANWRHSFAGASSRANGTAAYRWMPTQPTSPGRRR